MGNGGTLIKMLQEVHAAGWAYINIQPTTILWNRPRAPKRTGEHIKTEFYPFTMSDQHLSRHSHLCNSSTFQAYLL